MNENMYLYTSSAFWWTPEGSEGLRHCARRFETSALEGTVAIVGGRACSAYNHSMISSCSVCAYVRARLEQLHTLRSRLRQEI